MFGRENQQDAAIAGLRRRVDAQERALQSLAQLVGVSDADLAALQAEAVAAPPEIQRLLRDGKRVQAIKAYRGQTGAGLAEAKHAVDEIEAGLR